MLHSTVQCTWINDILLVCKTNPAVSVFPLEGVRNVWHVSHRDHSAVVCCIEFCQVLFLFKGQ